jgi:FkbM family methyltransferase
MSIKKTKLDFKSNKYNKVEFIEKMHEFHKTLFDFAENLKFTEINSITIEDDNVIFTTRPTDFHPGGCRFFVDIVDKRVTPVDTFNFDMYEKEDSEMLFKLVKDGDKIFDIGANIGWYSNLLAKKLPNSTIYSFEPIPETFAQLKRNTILNESNNVLINNVALSSKKEKISFYYSPTVTGASSMVNITENSDMVKLECITSTLDDFVQENNIDKLNFIKCDVEGGEFLVFKGAKETILKHKPIIFTEMLRKWSAKFNYHPNDIINLFKSVGYKCFYSSNGKLEAIDFILEDTIPTNFFFLQPEVHSDLILKNS